MAAEKNQTIDRELENEEKENNPSNMAKEDIAELNVEDLKEELNQDTEHEEHPIDEKENQLNQQIDELQNRLVRTQADFENYKRRTRIEKEDFAKYASAKLIEGLLPAYDNFQRAIHSSTGDENYKAFFQGIEMIYKQIEDVLTKEGLEPIEAVGKPFNPELHQAVMQVESDEFDSGFVVEELQKGYKLKDKVIRPSMVKVNM